MPAKKKTEKKTQIVIPPVNMKVIAVPIIGTAPYCQHAFSAKARAMMLEAQTSTAKKKKKAPRDVEDEFQNAMHKASEGWVGIPASAFRAAMISACRLVGFQMTRAKLSVFVEADGLDEGDGQPLVRLVAGEPELSEMAVRLESGVASVAIRPLWREWGALVRVRYDGDQFTASDVVNLIDRAGQQVGIGEGRPDSRKSTGLGWGTFEVDAERIDEVNK
jgi:hypothetical protein